MALLPCHCAPAAPPSLQAGHLGGAGVDVLSMEPPLGDHPLLTGDIPRLIVTPHIAWASREAPRNLVRAAAEDL